MFAAKAAKSFNFTPRRSYSVGQNILNAPGTLRDVSGNTVKPSEFFKGKKVMDRVFSVRFFSELACKVIVLGVPGAFTPVCSTKHVGKLAA